MTLAKSAARSLLVLFAPRFRPTGTPLPRRDSRAQIACMPSLLKPNRLIAARSSVRRKSLGRGLPGWGRGVAAPTSIKPKPARHSGATAVAFLSKPAASPTGFGRSRPATLVRKRGEVCGPGAGASPPRRARIAKPCAASGSSRCRARRPSRSISGVMRSLRPSLRGIDVPRPPMAKAAPKARHPS